MSTLNSTTNPFGGVVIDPESLPNSAEEFDRALRVCVDLWAEGGVKVVWLEIPIAKSHLIPVAVDAGFTFHHSGAEYLMLTRQLVPGAYIPPYATHYIGAGGVVLNAQQDLLVVCEKRDQVSRPPYYKLPGGALRPGEHLVDGVIREICEETGVRSRFESLVCFRHWHGYRFGKSDIYFVCRLSPLTCEITIQEDEIEESLWMPVQDFLSHEHVGVFNKHIVHAALNGHCGLAPQWIDGYDVDPGSREIFLPQD